MVSTRGNNLVALPLVDLTPFLDGYDDPVVLGVGHDGSVYAVARKSREPLVEVHDTAIFAKSRLVSPAEHLVVRWKAGVTRMLVWPDETLLVSFVQPHPEGVLLVGARCRWTQAGAEKNALVVDWEGREVHRFTVGDGVEDVRVAPNGTIWISYFDEGIFGNYGWGGPGPEGIGADGLVAFDARGEVVRRYDAEAAGTDFICDAYVTNLVANGDLWVYFYTDFPIVKVSPDGYRVWRPEVVGARALCVQGSHVLLVGDYEDRCVVRTLELLDEDKTRLVETRRLVDDAGAALDDARCIGVGEHLYVFSGRKVLIAGGYQSEPPTSGLRTQT